MKKGSSMEASELSTSRRFFWIRPHWIWGVLISITEAWKVPENFWKTLTKARYNDSQTSARPLACYPAFNFFSSTTDFDRYHKSRAMVSNAQKRRWQQARQH